MKSSVIPLEMQRCFGGVISEKIMRSGTGHSAKYIAHNELNGLFQICNVILRSA